MSEQAWFNRVALALVAVVIVGFLAGLGLGGLSGSSNGSANGGGASPAFHVYLTISTNPDNGLDQYFPSNFTVPAGVPVTIVITNYDMGINNITGMPYGTSHSFTIGSIGLSVPVPAASSPNDPTVTSFTQVFQSGTYSWMCLAPCDPTSMGASGYMSGTVTAQ